MAHKASPHQQGVYDFISNGKGNAVVAAVAGSGKSTTIINAMSLISPVKQSHFFAFNSTIAKELKHRIPQTPNVSASTIHSFGLKAILKENADVNMSEYIDGLKYAKIFDKIYVDDENEDDTHGDCKQRVMPMVDLARVNLSEGRDEIFAMADKYGLAVSIDDCTLAYDVIRIGRANMDSIDFTDMIYLPVFHEMNVKTYDYVFIDECQDLSELQRTLVMKSVRPNTGRFIAVGDQQQAIYGFAGADAESFNKLRQMPNVTQLPLSVCYRCGSDIINLAKTIVPQIEAFDGNGTGEVRHDAMVADIKAGDMILCRNTYPLVKLGFQFIAAGVKATIVGKDIGANLISMIRKTKATDFDKLYKKFSIELGKIVKDMVRLKGMTEQEAETSNKYASYQDKIDAIRIIGEGCGDLDEVIGKIEGIFGDDDKSGIVLSTIHKAKGLEANNVFIIHRELMPSKHAELPWEKEQERNLMYVAYTRAKNVLGFVSDFDAYDGKPLNLTPRVEQPKEEQKIAVGQIIEEDFEINEITDITSSFGTTKKYTLVSKTGLTVSKVGSMNHSQLISGGSLKQGSVVRVKAPVKQISQFQGVDQVTLGMLQPLK